MLNVTYQAVCYTHNRYIGQRTTNYQTAVDDVNRHKAVYPDDDVDIRVFQSYTLNLKTVDWDQIEPFRGE